jgi:hypothetical protein
MTDSTKACPTQLLEPVCGPDGLEPAPTKGRDDSEAFYSLHIDLVLNQTLLLKTKTI